MIDAAQGFASIFRQAAGDRLAADAADLLDMFADEAVVEFPFAPPGQRARLSGKAAITQYLQGLAGQFAFDRFGEPEIHATVDPAWAIAEFDVFARNSATGEPYNQRYVSFIGLKDGRIVHYREYWDPLVVVRALKGSAVVDAIVGSGER